LRIRINGLLIGVLFFLLLVQVGTFGISSIANAQSEIGIPGWIKTNAGWWANGDIDDTSFVQGIQYLIKEDIMQIPPTAQGSSGSTNEIPGWIKTNAGWWANGDIDDTSFVQGIQFLIKDGIMRVPTLGPDLDRDGIPDDVDQCPTQAETVNEYEDSDGCPDEPPIEPLSVDTDGDGIEDGSDNCPVVANASQTDLDGDKLGDVCDPDIDGDNILNGADRCPSEPENNNNFEDSDGCPDEKVITTLSIFNIEVDTPNSGWGDENIFVYWTFDVGHDGNQEEFPTQGGFTIRITGFGIPIEDEATYKEGNTFSGKYTEGIDAGENGGPLTLTIVSFIGDEKWEYSGGDQKVTIIPPNNDNNND